MSMFRRSGPSIAYQPCNESSFCWPLGRGKKLSKRDGLNVGQPAPPNSHYKPVVSLARPLTTRPTVRAV